MRPRHCRPRGSKKNTELYSEKQGEIQSLIGSLRKARERGDFDLEAWEEAILRAAIGYGANLLAELLSESGCGRPSKPVLDDDDQPMHSIGVRPKTITTLLGKITFRRSVFRNASGTLTSIPLDQTLGVEGTAFSPGVRRMMARAGSRTSFTDASEDLCVYARLDITPKQIQRVSEDVGRAVEDWICKQKPEPQKTGETPAHSVAAATTAVPKFYVSFDGTGIPVRKSELTASKGKATDGNAKTREVKLGCVFTQTRTDEEGRPVRDPDSTTYVGAIESSTLFGMRIYQEAVRRGCERARQIIVLTDGARYNKTIAATHFPRAIHIIDLYHAREHLAELAKALGLEEAQQNDWRGLLDMGRIEDILSKAKAHIESLSASAVVTGELRKKLGYFEQNADLMRYADFRLAGYFVGSGVVEAGCRTVIGQRLKRSGMFWSVRGANSIIAVRCCQISGRFEDFWAAAA